MVSTDPARPSSPEPPLRRAAGEKGLKTGALGLASSVVIGLASTAPAYSLAATLGIIVAGVGLQSPIVMVLAFVPMFLIAYGYKELNEDNPDCGTTFTWGSRTFGPMTGWMGGWAIIVADVVVMANLAQIAGQYGFQLVGAHGLAEDTFWTTFAGVVWIVLMTWICYVGIELSANLQKVLLTIEIVVLVALGLTALWKVYLGNAPDGSVHVAWSWFDPFEIDSVDALTKGVLAAVFIYWGWDTAVSINEETADSARTPGRAAVISTVLLLLIYVLISTSALSFAGAGDTGNGLANPDNSGDVLSSLGSSVFGSVGFGWFMAKLLVFMVLTSSAASTQTTILPTARTALSMAAHRAIPAKFARVHTRNQVPTWSTVGMGIASVAFYVAITRVSTNVLTDSIGSIGLAIAFYYGITGFACVWYHRRVLTRSRRDLLTKGIMPGLGGALLAYFFVDACYVYSDKDYGTTYWSLPFAPHWQLGGVFLTGIGALLLGAVLMLGYRFVAPSFFRGETLPRAVAPRDAVVEWVGTAGSPGTTGSAGSAGSTGSAGSGKSEGPSGPTAL
ncbi:amino acid transporter [Embleya scabrispora]|uniref:Amino acid transporter n=1 Tax=Embleya scabrispora TaxID=159449 RepID=A0A1T3P4R1_9ACTN|nr:amino acid permease [Embleya scabrispora]OPC83935.1 amino acid transporter [Embleya scabrispora]